ncbi:zinc ribbon domain-containing protein [Sulfurisphaera javensis]|uniref:Zinc ribbon domain-containing protein n=1 Tax=Sulfurisphaera javensis TaxID=2049879 RepID=A0AAT9GPZ6_9CREN
MSYNPPPPNPPPSKHRKWLPIIIGIVIAVAIIASVPVILALINPSPVVVSASTAQSVFGGSWTVVTNETYFAKYPINYVTIEYANGTNVTIPYPHQVKSIDHEVLIGKVNNTSVTMIIQVITYTSNVTLFHHDFGFFGGIQWGNNGFSFNVTSYNGYTLIYYASSFPHPHTSVTAIKGNEVVQIRIIGTSASLQQVEEIISNLYFFD